MSKLLGTLVVILVGAGLVNVGCSSDSGEPAGPCRNRGGATYRSVYTTRSGNCGNIPEDVTHIDAQPTGINPPCTGSITYSADNCKVTVQVKTCPDGSSSTGVFNWSKDGAHGQGTFDAHGKSCDGSYDVTITRL